MKINLTTILLSVIIAVAGWMLLKPKLLAAGRESPINNPKGGQTNVGQQDLVGQVTGAAKSLFDAIGSIAQAVQQEH